MLPAAARHWLRQPVVPGKPALCCSGTVRMSAIPAKPRHPWLAVLLALLGGPLGHIYAGRLRRGLWLWIVGQILGVFFFLVVPFTSGPLGIFAGALSFVGYSLFLMVDAYRVAAQQRDTLLRPYQRWWIYLLAYVIAVVAANANAYAIRDNIMEAFVVPTRSMSPTILPGDRLLADKLWSHPSNLRRNDVVVFSSRGPNSALWVMRVVGLPGDRIEIRDEKVLINDEESADPHGFLDPDLAPVPELSNFGPITIAADEFFVLGDNRRRSNDSRTLGPIPFSSFHSLAKLIYFSVERNFPNPEDTTHYENRGIRWERIGLKLN